MLGIIVISSSVRQHLKSSNVCVFFLSAVWNLSLHHLSVWGSSGHVLWTWVLQSMLGRVGTCVLCVCTRTMLLCVWTFFWISSNVCYSASSTWRFRRVTHIISSARRMSATSWCRFMWSRVWFPERWTSGIYSLTSRYQTHPTLTFVLLFMLLWRLTTAKWSFIYNCKYIVCVFAPCLFSYYIFVWKVLPFCLFLPVFCHFWTTALEFSSPLRLCAMSFIYMISFSTISLSFFFLVAGICGEQSCHPLVSSSTMWAGSAAHPTGSRWQWPTEFPPAALPSCGLWQGSPLLLVHFKIHLLYTNIQFCISNIWHVLLLLLLTFSEYSV